ncbi:NUDIX hydrolase domain-like protein [Scheffersomyces xylosifermentans]|uniref:NUDIX hydrolase domain-like protein n=1 Tax=Scheffersomyces xylosifermentans TaxID=1304137 RepID=UPI00315C93E9
MVTREQYLQNIKNHVVRHFQNHQESIWHKLPISRRSSVFILLFLGQLGELRVILTKRSSKLRNFPGHISLPGGKADDGLESEWHVARREMEEEIGLSSNNDELEQKYGFTIDHLNILPSYLSRTFSAVRPCIGYMNFSKKVDESDLIHNLKINLNPGESSSIFSCPLRDFLYPVVEEEPLESLDRNSYAVKWGGIPWNLRSYTFLQTNSNEASWLKGIKDLSASEDEDDQGTDIDNSEKESVTPPEARKKTKKDLSEWGRLGSRRHSETNEKIYDVWGLTANILHDLADVTYRGPPKRELGEEELIYSIWKYGNQMRAKERSEAEVKLIQSKAMDDFGFGEILPRTEFNRLKKLYKL